MKKITKLLNVFLLSTSFTSVITSCDSANNKETTTEEAKIEFNFDDKYFIGMQEHFYEIRTMEPSINTDFICDLNAAIGSKVFRINVTMNNLFRVERNNTVKFNDSVKNQFHICIEKLKASGVEKIVYATDSFIYPYGYSVTHPISVPDPYTEREAYEGWLKVNATGYGMMAAEFPEITVFEPINEPDIPNNEVICKNGMIWGTTDPNFMYSAYDEANILADLCYYINREIKKVDKNNLMSSPAFSSLNSTYEYLTYFYEAIESGAHPICSEDPVCTDPDEYFDVVNLHPYSFVQENVNPVTQKEDGVILIDDTYAEACLKFYDICCKHGDAEKPHWYTELGYTDNGSTAAANVIGRQVTKQLEIIKEKLPFVESVIFYKMCDFYTYYVSTSEDHFGLFYSPSHKDEPMKMKPIMESIYKFMHNTDTVDYTAFDAVRAKYCKTKED